MHQQFLCPSGGDVPDSEVLASVQDAVTGPLLVVDHSLGSRSMLAGPPINWSK
jgi:hypothetical protein